MSTEEDLPHALHLMTLPWLDEVPLAPELGRPNNGGWGPDCFLLALDCQSGCAFRVCIDPDVVVTVSSDLLLVCFVRAGVPLQRACHVATS